MIKGDEVKYELIPTGSASIEVLNVYFYSDRCSNNK